MSFQILRPLTQQPQYAAPTVPEIAPLLLVTPYHPLPPDTTVNGSPVRAFHPNGAGYVGSSTNYFQWPIGTIKDSAGAGSDATVNKSISLSFIVGSNSAARALLTLSNGAVSSTTNLIFQNNSGTLRVYYISTWYDLGPAVIGKLHTISITYEDFSPYPAKIYLDGLLKHTINTYNNIWDTYELRLGAGFPAAGTTDLYCQLLVLQSARADLSEAWHLRYGQNPWSIYQPRHTLVPVSPGGGGGATVDVPAAALTLAGFAPTVSTPQTVSVPAGSLTLTGFAPTVSTPRTVAVPAGALTLLGFAPVVVNPASISIPVGSLTLTGYAPTVSTALTISVPAGSLSLTGFAPTVSTPRTVSIPLGTLTLTGYAPLVTASTPGTTVSVPAGALSLTGFAPTVSISAVIPIPAGALSLTGYAPTISTSVGTVVPMPAGSLALTGYAPTVYSIGDTTTSLFYMPLRAYADGMSGTVDPTTALDNLRSLLPSQRTPLVNADSTMSSQWYRFFDYMVNQYLGGLTQPTVADIVASVEAAMTSVTASNEATQLIAQQAQANAESLAAVVQVTQNAAIPGSAQIPPVSLSYLEP